MTEYENGHCKCQPRASSLQMRTSGEVVRDHANHPNYDSQVSRKIDDIFTQNMGKMSDAFDDFVDFVSSLKNQLNTDVVEGDFIVNTLILP